jgi:hypothetical protein
MPYIPLIHQGEEYQMPGNSENKRPTHNVYFIKHGKDGEEFWQKVGAGWEHKDGKGQTQRIEFFGFNVELVVRRADESKQSSQATKKEQGLTL